MRASTALAAPGLLAVAAALLAFGPALERAPGVADVLAPATARGSAEATPLQTPAGELHLLEIDGVINPLTSRYLQRGIDEATQAGAAAVVLRLDTPGGLESAMREMSAAILNSPVPVVVWVGPSGARAASAGMFLTIAAHVAAMAPGTNIGAAHPVGLGGGQADTVATTKAVNDAAALARSIARTRGRNAEWAERAVRRSVSITADEALDDDVVDLIAADLDALLRQADGRAVAVAGDTVVLRTAGARVVARPMSLPARVVQTITDPNIAYILFTLGVIGLIAEFYNPGMLFPGITGAISLILAFVAFGSLPVSWAGVLLLLLGIGLFIGELYTEGLGVLGVAGVAAFLLGSLMLYRPLGDVSPALPPARVSPWVLAATMAVLGGFVLIVLRALVGMRGAPAATGVEAMVGRTGEAVSDLEPAGRVRIAGEEWTAVAARGRVDAGERVRVVGVEGVTLRVEPV